MIGPEEIWAEAVRTLEREKPFALATVVNVRGSTPREVGAKMIVRDDGQFGTIGGGCGEAEVFRKARVLLEDDGEARLAEVEQLAGRVAVLDEGRLLGCDTPQGLMASAGADTLEQSLENLAHRAAQEAR